MPQRDAQQGLTLVELVFALAALAVVMLGFHMVLISSLRLGDISHEKNVVAFDISTVVGHIRNQPLESLTDPDYMDAAGGPRVMHGGIVDPTLYRRADDPDAGAVHLPDQEMIVYYMGDDGSTLPLPGDKTDPVGTHNLPAGFESPDPLTFVVECTWSDAYGEPRVERITAIRTQ